MLKKCSILRQGECFYLRSKKHLTKEHWSELKFFCRKHLITELDYLVREM